MTFTLTGSEQTYAVRTMFTMVDDPAIADESKNYQANPFIWGGSSAYDISHDDEYEIPIEVFAQPEWTNLDGDQDGARDPGAYLDLTMLHALEFMIVTRPEVSAEYEFCISGLYWHDDSGTAIAVDPAPR